VIRQYPTAPSKLPYPGQCLLYATPFYVGVPVCLAEYSILSFLVVLVVAVAVVVVAVVVVVVDDDAV
jgi:hypothetical protein